MLSAVGTMLAVITSLWLVLREEKREIKIAAKLTETTSYNPSYMVVDLLNVSKMQVKIVEIGIIQKNKKKISEKMFYPSKNKPPIFIDEQDNINYRQVKSHIENVMEENNYSSDPIRFYAKDNTGKMYYSNKLYL